MPHPAYISILPCFLLCIMYILSQNAHVLIFSITRKVNQFLIVCGIQNLEEI